MRSEVFAKTGIPPNMQQLLANRKLVKSSSDLTKNSTLNLKVKLCGGGNCDICYISGSLFICKECEQTLCAECNARVHQHPKRTHHKTNPLSECTENITNLDVSNSNMFDSLEDFETQLSQGSEQSFSDAILVATLAEKFGLTSFKPFQKGVIMPH